MRAILMRPMLTWTSKPFNACRKNLTARLDAWPIDTQRINVRIIKAPFDKKLPRAILLLAVAIVPVTIPDMARAQSVATQAGSAAGTEATTVASPSPAYERPTQKTMASNYLFEAFGPYPFTNAALAAGISQLTDAPPEWHQGVEGYSKRLGSDFGIAATGTTTRYALGEALKEDTLYYRCECRGIFPRLRHAVISTLMARRGDDGHRVFSIPTLVAPYAGTMTAVYSWYPSRFGAKDGFRMGNYDMLAYVGGNIALEFFYTGPHSLMNRMHLNNPRGAPYPGPNH